jgi:hypothetical protein
MSFLLVILFYITIAISIITFLIFEIFNFYNFRLDFIFRLPNLFSIKNVIVAIQS